jgi:hypothetical protein
MDPVHTVNLFLSTLTHNVNPQRPGSTLPGPRRNPGPTTFHTHQPLVAEEQTPRVTVPPGLVCRLAVGLLGAYGRESAGY